MASRIAQIRKSVLTLALPVTVSSLLQRTEGIAAVFLVGGLGATSIAAVGLGQLLAFMATTLVSGLSVGANVLVAQLWGARRTKDVGEAATHLLGLAAIVSCTLMALGWSLNRVIMELLGAENDVITLALPYSNLIFLVIPCAIFLQVLSSIMQGTGDTRTPMYALIAVNLLYLSIAYPLIYGLWGLPALGITGAAVATGLAEGIGVAYLLWACRKIFKTSLHVRRDLLRSTWQIGASVSGERMFQQAGILLYTKIVLVYGTVTYAAHQVGLSIESLSFLPGYGFAIASAAMGVLFFFFPYLLLRAFTNDEAVVELGTVFLRIVAILQIPLALTMVLAGSLRGAGDTRFIMFTTTIGMWGVRLPLAIIAGPWLALDVLFVWTAMIADWTVRMGLLLWRYRSERWKAIQVMP